MDTTIIEVRKVTKQYQLGDVRITALRDVSLTIQEGELVIIMGPSGSGKSTLLNILGGIDHPTSGSVCYHVPREYSAKKGSLFQNHVDDTKKQQSSRKIVDLSSLSPMALTKFRKQYLAYVFQFYSLLPSLTARENVELVLELIGITGKAATKRAEHYLQLVGLEHRMDNYPSQLSGGEQQRVAIARALAKNPLVLLLDEPTGQLDENTSLAVAKTLKQLNDELAKTMVIVTHDPELKDFGDRLFYFDSGLIMEKEVSGR